jgi:hypothetical protein
MQKKIIIKKIKAIIKECGSFSTGEVMADHSPCIFGLGSTIILAEKFGTNTVTAVTNLDGNEVDENEMAYENLEKSVLEEILELAEQWVTENE